MLDETCQLNWDKIDMLLDTIGNRRRISQQLPRTNKLQNKHIIHCSTEEIILHKTMSVKTCLYCHHAFLPAMYAPEQK